MFIVIAHDYDLSQITKVFHYLPEAELFANQVTAMGKLRREIRDTERETRHEYWDSNNKISNLSRRMDNYHKTSKYKKLSSMINKIEKMLESIGAPYYASSCEILEKQFEE